MPAVIDALKWLEMTAPAVFVMESVWAFQALLMVHLTAIALVVGMISVVDLRLLGLASTNCAVSDVCREVLPWTWTAFALSTITGVLLFLAQPVKYIQNTAFQMKFLLLAVAGINMLIFQLVVYRGVAKWDRGEATPLAGKLAGAISLVSWLAIVAYGRWTAYYAV